MSNKVTIDVGSSIRQRLLNLAHASHRSFNEVLQYYMIERFIYRLSKSSYRHKLILKGALMFVAWNLTETRATRDIDLLGKTSHSIENITQIIRDICLIDCPEDAANFLPETIDCSPIQERNEYHGIRVRFFGELAKARTRMQIDIGFGDSVSPCPQDLYYPTLLEMPQPSIMGYTPESLIAEKVHAMIKLGIINSRIKDYYDVWFLSQQFPFKGYELAAAIKQTFLTRRTALTNFNIDILHQLGSDEVKHRYWKAYIEKNQLLDSAISFNSVINQIELFIYPIFEYQLKNKEFEQIWKPPGPWS
jgi:predicted nucleotidyltransferase component of viral defense system